MFLILDKEVKGLKELFLNKMKMFWILWMDWRKYCLKNVLRYFKFGKENM